MEQKSDDGHEVGKKKGEWKMDIVPEQDKPAEKSEKAETDSSDHDLEEELAILDLSQSYELKNKRFSPAREPDKEKVPEKAKEPQKKESLDSEMSGAMVSEIPPELKKNPMSFVISSLIVVVVLLLLFGLYQSFTKKASEEPDSTGNAEMSLTYKNGEVKIKKSGKNAWEVMQENGAVKTGDQIQTGVSNKNVISIGDGCNIRLADITQLEINSCNASGSDITGSFTLNSGKIWVNTKNFKEFKVFADSGIFTAGNSIFNLSIDPAKGAVIEVLQGSVNIASSTDPTMTIPVKAGEMSTVKGSNIAQPEALTLDASNEWYAWNLSSDSRENLVYNQNNTSRMPGDTSTSNQETSAGTMQTGQPRMQPGQQGGQGQGGMMPGGQGQGGMMQGGQGQGGMMQGGQGQGGMMQGGQGQGGMMQGGQGQGGMMQGGQGRGGMMPGGQGQGGMMQGGQGGMIQGGQGGMMQGGQGGMMQGGQGRGGMMPGGQGQGGMMQGGQGQGGMMQGGQGQGGMMPGGQGQGGMMPGGQGQGGMMQGGQGQGGMEPGAGPGAGNERPGGQGGMGPGGQGPGGQGPGGQEPGGQGPGGQGGAPGMQPGYGPNNQGPQNYTQNMGPGPGPGPGGQGPGPGR